MTNNELKPCPFCGGKNVSTFEEQFISLTTRWYVCQCEECGIFSRIDRGGSTEQEAIDAWNRRVGEQEQ